MKAAVFNIQSFSTNDGPGIRTVVFFQGCNLRCLWCHNPESWDDQPPPAFIKEKCIGCGCCVNMCDALKREHGSEYGGIDPGLCRRCGRCDDICYSGALTRPCRVFTPEELWKLLAVDKPYFQNSKGGITFSGGEAMLHTDFLAEMISICREEGVHTAVDTAGHVPYEWLVRVNPDLFLYDIKAACPEKHVLLTGVDGVLIWENLRRLIEDGYKVCVRVPCVPGANWDQLPAIGTRLCKLGILAGDIEPLAYHKLGEGKAAWYKHGQEGGFFNTPSEEEMEEAVKLLKR